jgi:hypothetical protein
MTEAEFERRLNVATGSPETQFSTATGTDHPDGLPTAEIEMVSRSSTAQARSRSPRSKPAKPKRVQRMFAIEEDVDKKLWLYAIHMGKDRSEVVNDLLRPIVASMVLYDSRDRRGVRNTELAIERTAEGEGEGESDPQN